ncbi:MAG: PAS domain S-box protein, partial [Burkholderiales bacterium]
MLKKLVGQIRIPEPRGARRDSFATMLGLLQDAAIVTDDSARVLYLNSAAEKLTGWESTSAEGMSASQVIRFDGTSSFPNPIEQALLQPRMIPLPTECTILQRTGARLAVEGHVAP